MLRPESWSRLAVERRWAERGVESLFGAGGGGTATALARELTAKWSAGEQPDFGWLVGRAQAGRPAEG
jgi:hypothetical protein